MVRKATIPDEHPKRSFIKAITYRLVIMISDGVIIYLITRRTDVAVSVILLSNLASTVLYYLHERVWVGIRWGR